MFKFLLHRIWKNKFIRYLLITTGAVIAISSILKIKFPLYNFIQKIFEDPEFDNPISYRGKPYGYSANPNYARKNLKNALEDLIELSNETYDEETDDEEIFSKKVIQLETNWSSNLTRKSLSSIHKLFYDLRLYCMQVTSTPTASSKWTKEKKLKKRHLKIQQANNFNPFKFAVTKNNIKSLIEDLMDIDYNYLYPAIQKKPDSWGIITLHEQIQQTACKPYRGIAWWQRALFYLEYKQEKQIYHYYIKYNKNASFAQVRDSFPEKVFSELKKNIRYKEILKEFFLRNKLVSWNDELKLKQTWSNYSLTQDFTYLIEYIQLMKKKSRMSGATSAKKIYLTLLKKVRYKNIEANPQYLLALAETAFHAKMYNLALANVNRVLKEALIQSKFIKKQAQRIKLMIELSMP